LYTKQNVKEEQRERRLSNFHDVATGGLLTWGKRTPDRGRNSTKGGRKDSLFLSTRGNTVKKNILYVMKHYNKKALRLQ
jgi:hypothetical protein